MAKKPKAPTEITSTRHKNETRVNIPTEELRDLVAEDEKAPKAVLYPRDSSLDRQLVWKGKDEQDQAALEVPVVPIYIQEKVHPQALVENLRKTGEGRRGEPELTLFSDHDRWDRRPSDGRGPRRRCLRSDHGGDPQHLDGRHRPAGSSTPTTTARASSSATRTSRAATSCTRN
jgi:hypothetical protein